MNISKISANPGQSISNFCGSKSENPEKKVRYKHYWEMSNEDLKARSVAKAYDTVKKCGKMRIKEALPAITSLAIGTSLTLTQPGKFSTRLKTGLGFLALSTMFDTIVTTAGRVLGKYTNFVSNKVDKHFDKNNDLNKEKRTATKLGILAATGAAVAGAGFLVSSLKKGITPDSNKVLKFIEKEKTTLSNELNSSKVGQFFEKTINPFTTKHSKAMTAVGIAVPFGIIAGSNAINTKLSNSISKDMNKLAVNNYINGVAAQMDARKHFDSIDATEI